MNKEVKNRYSPPSEIFHKFGISDINEGGKPLSRVRKLDWKISELETKVPGFHTSRDKVPETVEIFFV
jgi:hypothetical protein